MNLFTETTGLLRWFYRIGAVFFGLRPITTSIIVVASTLSLIAGILAFVLPLKIILLVASDGVSRWFQPFVGSDGKDTLVIVLTVAAVVSFFASIVLDALTARLSASTSQTVLQGSNRLAIVGNQDDKAQSIYAQYTDCLASTLFVTAGLTVIGLVNPSLLAILAGALALQFVFTAGVLARADRINPGFLARFVTQDFGDYLQLLSALNFLLAFAVLLYPFLTGGGGSVIAALISIIVLRRLLGVMVQTIRTAAKMRQREAVIDALVFRDRQFKHAESRHTQTLREVFHKAARQERTAEALRTAGVKPYELDACWEDARVQGLGLIGVHVTDRDGASAYYQQQIYLPRQDHRLENETVLFDHIARERLNAPPVIARFSEGPFQCQICSAGTGELPPESDWGKLYGSLLERTMVTSPPLGLERAFCLSRPLLGDRLTDELVERLETAVDTDEEAAALARFRATLPEFRQRLHEMPRYVYNPEIKWANVRIDREGTPLIMTWGNWSLEPLGAGMPDNIKPHRIDELANIIAQDRTDVRASWGSDSLLLANQCWELERQITRNRLKAGLSTAQQILSNAAVAADASGNYATAGVRQAGIA